MRVTVKEPHPFPSLCLLAKNRFLSLLLPQCLTDVFLQRSHSKKSQCLQLNLARPDKRHKAACWGWSMKNLLVVLHCRLCWQVTEIHGLSIRKRGVEENLCFSFSTFVHVVTSQELYMFVTWLEGGQSIGPSLWSRLKSLNNYRMGCLKSLCRPLWFTEDKSLWLKWLN